MLLMRVFLPKAIVADVFIRKLCFIFQKSVVADLSPKSVLVVVFIKLIVAPFVLILSSPEPLLPMVNSFCTYQPLQLACTHIFIPSLLSPTRELTSWY